MIFVELDFETRSLCDLKVCGAERYAEDPSTDVMCLVYKREGVYHEWWPGCAYDAHLTTLVLRTDVIFVAHNAAFEQAIWRHIMVPCYGFPEIPIERWRCTMAASAWRGLPLALDKVGRALYLPVSKDREGNKLTLSMSNLIRSSKKSRANGTVHMLPELTAPVRQRIMDYCRQDVVVENGVKGRIGLLSEAEQRVWQLDQSINQRGVRLDLAFVAACQTVVDKASAPLRAEFQDLTGLDKVGSPKLLDWCLENGTKLDNLQKKTLAKLLDVEEDDGSPDAGYGSLAGGDDGDNELCGNMCAERLPSSVLRVLKIRQMLGGAAIKKLKRMQACCGYDGRARGLLQYHAAHSGRWGGRLLQPQNFPRETIIDPETRKPFDPEIAISSILSGDPGVVERELGLPALEAVARSLRHALVSDPGKVFVVGDYSQIEARIVLALAGQDDKTALMASGFPVYFDMAEDIYNRPKGSWAVTDKEQLKALKDQFIQEYTIGKNTILGCGFQMGSSKFHDRYCPDQPVQFAEQVVHTYRKEWAPKVPQVWYGLERASLNAVQDAKSHEAYGVVYKRDGEFLRCDLPSGWQHLWYYGPSLGESRFGNLAWNSMQSKQGKWIKVDMYGGLETENVVQALARGLLVEAMFRVEKAGMPIVLTCHDEIMVEVDEDKADEVQFKQLMIQSRPWAEEMKIPVDAEVWTGTRYRK